MLWKANLFYYANYTKFAKMHGVVSDNMIAVDGQWWITLWLEWLHESTVEIPQMKKLDGTAC